MRHVCKFFYEKLNVLFGRNAVSLSIYSIRFELTYPFSRSFSQSFGSDLWSHGHFTGPESGGCTRLQHKSTRRLGTWTRKDGWIDLMVNGGGRSTFRPQSRIVQVPWHVLVIIDIVTMSISEKKAALATIAHSCFSHDYGLMKPVLLVSWKHAIAPYWLNLS